MTYTVIYEKGPIYWARTSPIFLASSPWAILETKWNASFRKPSNFILRACARKVRRSPSHLASREWLKSIPSAEREHENTVDRTLGCRLGPRSATRADQ